MFMLVYRLDRKRLDDLVRKGRKYLDIVQLKKGENPALMWNKYRNPLRQAINYGVMLFCKVMPPCGLKNSLYRLIGIKIGKGVSIANDVILDPIYPELIVIEDDAIVGWGTRIFTHEFTHTTARIGSVIIGRGALIGEFSVVRPGVTVGRKSLITAMSFVNRDVPDGLIEGGIPIHILHLKKRSRKNK